LALCVVATQAVPVFVRALTEGLSMPKEFSGAAGAQDTLLLPAMLRPGDVPAARSGAAIERRFQLPKPRRFHAGVHAALACALRPFTAGHPVDPKHWALAQLSFDAPRMGRSGLRVQCGVHAGKNAVSLRISGERDDVADYSCLIIDAVHETLQAAVGAQEGEAAAASGAGAAAMSLTGAGAGSGASESKSGSAAASSGAGACGDISVHEVCAVCVVAPHDIDGVSRGAHCAGSRVECRPCAFASPVSSAAASAGAAAASSDASAPAGAAAASASSPPVARWTAARVQQFVCETRPHYTRLFEPMGPLAALTAADALRATPQWLRGLGLTPPQQRSMAAACAALQGRSVEEFAGAGAGGAGAAAAARGEIKRGGGGAEAKDA
jgi:hypothetical protein